MTEPERPNGDDQGWITEEQIDRHRRWSLGCGVAAIVCATLLGWLCAKFLMHLPRHPMDTAVYAIAWWPLAIIATVFGLAALGFGTSGLAEIPREGRDRAVKGAILGLAACVVVIITFALSDQAVMFIFAL
jgi:hypothetical protein